MIGIISSRLLGILSPGLRYLLTSTDSKTCLSLSSELDVTDDWSEPAHTRMGVLRFGSRDAGASPGSPAPMLITPPNSTDPESDAESDEEDDVRSGEAEAIDQDEIFGAPCAFCSKIDDGCVSLLMVEIVELIRSISDPEHRNMTLEQLAVVSAPQITFDARNPDSLTVEFTPTVPHCGMSTFIGKC